ncbi:MAG: DUF1080 domain-containing protein [Bacteroidota bacterium]
MKTFLIPLSFFFLALLSGSCNTENKIELFNGDNLDNWNIYVSSPDVNPEELFWVEEGVINTTGVPNGYIRTKESYSNFKLHVEWRWTGKPTNSGVLLHVQGKEMIWPLCTECQLMHEKAGDIVLIGKGSGITIMDTTYLVTSEENRYKVIPKFEDVSENPAGEWNSYDITSRDGNIEVLVNGVLQNSGSDLTLTEGNIALQSEGSAIQFRNIYLTPLE